MSLRPWKRRERDKKPLAQLKLIGILDQLEYAIIRLLLLGLLLIAAYDLLSRQAHGAFLR